MSITLDAGTSTETDDLVLTVLDFEPETKCDFTDQCTNTAEWMVVCGECQGSEVVCTQHAEQLAEQKREREFVLIFSHTCKHMVLASFCPIIPLG